MDAMVSAAPAGDRRAVEVADFQVLGAHPAAQLISLADRERDRSEAHRGIRRGGSGLDP